MELALAATVRDCGKNRLRIATLPTGDTGDRHARNQERDFVLLRDRVGGNLLEFLGVSRAHDRTQVTETAVPFHNLVGNGVERLRIVTRVIATDNGHVLEIVRTLVARTEQHVRAVLGILADERANGIGPHPGRNRNRVCTIHIVGRVRVCRTRLADIAALRVENHGNARTPVVGNQLLQHKHRLHAHAFVVSAVRLHHCGRNASPERLFQDFGIEALDFLFGTTLRAARVDKLEHRVHAEAHRVTALGNALLETCMEIRHYLSSSWIWAAS